MNPGLTNYIFVPYSYVITTAAVMAAGGVNATPWLLDQDADFELHEIFARSSVDGVADVRPNNFTFQVADKTSGRNWSDSAVPQAAAASMLAGWTIKRPVVIAKRSNMTITFTNTSGGNLTPTIVMKGAKILPFNQ